MTLSLFIQIEVILYLCCIPIAIYQPRLKNIMVSALVILGWIHLVAVGTGIICLLFFMLYALVNWDL